MGVNSMPKTVTRQRRDCDLNPDPSAPESSTLSTRLPSHPGPTYLSYSRRRLRAVYRNYPVSGRRQRVASGVTVDVLL